MSVDMFETRFREELRKLPAFVSIGQRDQRVWNEGFPAWHALFTSLCLYGHSTGYRLPSFQDFFSYCQAAYTQRHPKKAEYTKYFEGEFLPGMQQRVSVWYEAGMIETHLYASLVEAVEDKSKTGVVLYDPRADWKLKADMIVLMKSKAMRVSAFTGDEAERASVEAQRDTVERIRKRNTSESAHWNNAELEAMPTFRIAQKGSADFRMTNGIHLYSLSAINRLLENLYSEAGISSGFVFKLD